MFKWAWRQKLIKEYRLSSVSFPKAKARPQPCFHSVQVDKLMALAKSETKASSDNGETSQLEGNLRATGQSKIEKTLQIPEVQELVASLSNITERAGFEPAVGQALHSLSKAAP